MTRLIIISLTFLLSGIVMSFQNLIQTEVNDSNVVLSIIDTTKVSLVQLPRPNSGIFSFEEAEKRKNEIFNMQLSTKYFDWINPTSGGALHINKNDEIEVYQFIAEMMYLRKGVFAKGDSIVNNYQVPRDTSFVILKEDIKNYVSGFGFGNPSSVLITSEYDLKKSKSIELILEEIFEPSTQIYYLKKK